MPRAASRERPLGIPDVYRNPDDGFFYLAHSGIEERAAVKELRKSDLIVVLDISDLGRLGMLGGLVRDRGVPVACIDHHVSPGLLPPLSIPKRPAT